MAELQPGVAASVSGDPTKEDLPGFRMSEIGSTGISLFAGVISEEKKIDLQWPYAPHTYKEMSYDSAVSSALGIIEVLVKRAEWEVKVPEGADNQEIQNRADTLKGMMDDMERPWDEYIEEFLSYLVYGYSVNEIVFKRRRGKKSNTLYQSKYNDDVLGWAKLPSRSQHTIDRWIFDPDRNQFVGLRQNLNRINTNSRIYLSSNKLRDKANPNERLIPKKKYLHFRWNPKRDNPEGQSPLRNCYIPWRYKTLIEEYEAIGVSRDLGGLPVVQLPIEYMADDASEDKKAIYEYFKNLVRNIHANESAGVIMPKFVDPETKEDVFGFKLEGVNGGSKNYDTNAIINRYENKILMSFFADILKMGQDSVGSFALSDNKNNLLAFMVESQLKLIANVLNNHLIPLTYEMNGWEITDEMPYFDYGDIEDSDLDAIGKYVQRIVSVGAVETDKPMSDYLRGLLDLPSGDKSTPMDDELVNGKDSGAGKGMQEGNPNGTGKSVGRDSSTSNKENAQTQLDLFTYRYDSETDTDNDEEI